MVTQNYRVIEETLRDFIKVNKDYRLIVRYHPSENVSFKSQERVYFSPVKESLHGLLHCTDIVIVTTSTVGLEAHLMNKKVVSINNSIFTNDAPFSQMGISEGVSNMGELVDKIANLKHDLSTPNSTMNYLNATDNVMRVINEMLCNIS